jgi:hypothetical protein
VAAGRHAAGWATQWGIPGSALDTGLRDAALNCVRVRATQVDEFYDNLLAGKSGVTEISSFDASGFSTRFAGEIKVGSDRSWWLL